MEELAQVTQRVAKAISDAMPGSKFLPDEPRYGPNVTGLLVWDGFCDMEQIERQRHLSRAIKERLAPEDDSRVGVILTFAPDEWREEDVA